MYPFSQSAIMRLTCPIPARAPSMPPPNTIASGSSIAGSLEFLGENALAYEQESLEYQSLVLLVGDRVAQVLETVGDVARLVLHRAGEQDLLGRIVREPFAMPVNG